MTVVGGDNYAPGDEVRIWVKADRNIFGVKTWGLLAKVVSGPDSLGFYTLEANEKQGRFKAVDFVPEVKT